MISVHLIIMIFLAFMLIAKMCLTDMEGDIIPAQSLLSKPYYWGKQHDRKSDQEGISTEL